MSAASAGWGADVRTLLTLEWRRERRAPQVLPTMLLFSVGAFVLFRFGLQDGSIDGTLAAGVLLVTTLLAALLGIGRLWSAEEEEGGLDAFRLTPASAAALVAAKALALWSFLVVLHLVAVPAFAFLLLSSSLDAGELLRFAGIMLLLDLGIAAAGTLVGAIAAAARSRELLVPLLAVPLLIPVIAVASQAVSPLLEQHGGSVEGRWWLVLALYDGVFLLVGWAVSDGIVED
ncbi:ABC transporter involved in cytochrome c biogenesis CcmB subunit [Patulibacter medicamentivorans]|uniref:ABC transporter involved in cytochrome c biogenesis CcmB subunit n=1 Tax=Patulibacter medicamentivorans TaxID=1097667 RepID=H0EAU1_9ACTN|nr:heme exporter protein CcmB [Patulibacter medicamentivorans]EHN09213.1 ABC transporter involved in cytochrome c biogenesis CcmB subunit [Patulibacter medicamentivorans]